MTGLYLNHKDKKIPLYFPPGWELLSFCEVSSEPENENIQRETKRSLDNPIGSRRIEEIAKPGMKTVILFDDWQRPTPAHLVFPEVLNRLNRAGVSDENITAVCALGTHPPMSPDDMQRKIGAESYKRLSPRIFNHDARSLENVVVGRSAHGSVVEINPHVFDAALTIGIGTCVPHPWSGFGGGTKLIMPGICSEDTIAQHHLKWVQNRKTRTGLMEGNYFLEEQVEISEIIGFDFKIDFILNDENMPIKIFAGNPVKEHREAVQASLDCFKVSIPKMSDVGITSAFPLEVGLQSLKGLGTAVSTTKPGGYIIWLAPQENAESLQPIWEEVASKQSASDYMRDLMSGNYPPKCAPLGISLLITIHYMKAVTQKYSKIVHVTQGISPELVEAMGFTHAFSLQEAIEIVHRDIPAARVSVFPSGGAIFPVVEN
jgi:nickel-dependent lactate racemase